MNQKATLIAGLESALGTLRKDLVALPEDGIAKTFGGVTRSAADMVHEINLVNEHVVKSVLRQPLFDWPEGWIKAPDHLHDKEALLEAFDQTNEYVLAGLDSLSEEDLARSVTTERGETNGQERVRFMTLHVWYHSGQVNYIQTLLGDSAWHW